MALTTRGDQPIAIMAISAPPFIFTVEVLPDDILLALPANAISAGIRECC